MKFQFTTQRIQVRELDTGSNKRKPAIELIANDDDTTTVIERSGNRGRHLHVIDQPLDEVVTGLSGIERSGTPEGLAQRFVRTAKKLTE